MVVVKLPMICDGTFGEGDGDRRVEQRLIGVNAILRRLNGDVVADAVFGIEPEGRSGLEAGAQRDEQVLRDVFRLQADGLRAGAIDVEVQRGFVERLLNVDIDGAGDVAQLGGHFLCYGEIAVCVDAGDGDVDWRG